MNNIEERLEAIEARNQRVGLDKAWETSLTRRAVVALLTYVVVVGYLFVINNDNPLINGLVPVAGFLLSTLALKLVRARWENHK